MVVAGKRRAEYAPVAVLPGEDDFAKREHVERLKQESPDPCNHDFFDGAECSAGQVVSACMTLPFVGGRRLVVVSGAEGLLDSGGDILLEYMADPCPSTFLVLLFDKLNKRSRFFREASRRGWVIDCSPRKEGDIRSWLRRRVRDECGKDITADAARFLVEISGDDMNTLANEAEKLSLFVGDRKRVTREDVEEMSVPVRQPDIWALIGAVADRDEKRALLVCSRVVRRSSDVGSVLGLLRWNINRLWKGRELLEKGASGREIGRRLRVSGYFLNDFMARARSFRAGELYRNYRLLLEADWRIKTGRGAPRGILERLIISLCG